MLGGVGQARLLMASKLQQFAGLVDRCEARDSCAGLVTPADLQGFWDMVFIQVWELMTDGANGLFVGQLVSHEAL